MMRNHGCLVWLSATALLLPVPVSADLCRESFVKAMSRPLDGQASKSILTTVTSGEKPMINLHFSNGSGDWMSQVLDPPSIPWSLQIDSVLYASSDKGTSWKRVREMNDPEHKPEVILKQQEEAARAARNLTCGFEDIDGIRHEKFEADLVYPQMNMATRQTLWVHPDLRRTTKAHSIMRMPGMETAVTQIIEYLPGLILPKP